MTINGNKLNKKKIQAMITLGLGDALVHRFIKEKSKTLTMAGVKSASNIPMQLEKRVEFIANLFGKRPHLSILSDWVLQQTGLQATVDSPEAMAKLADLGAKQADDPCFAPLWTSVLLSFIQNPDSVEINTFLGDTPKAPRITENELRLRGGSEVEYDLDAAIRLAKGEEVPISQDQFFLKYIRVLIGVVTKSFDQVNKDLADLRDDIEPSNKKSIELLEALLGRAKISNQVIGRQKICANDTLPKGIVGHDSYQVLGRMISQASPGHRFFDIFGIIHEGHVYKLGKDEAKQVFPNRGSAIVFANKTAGLAIPFGSEWVLTIRLIEGAHEHSSKYQVSSVDHKLSEVVSVRHSSSEVDAVRDAICRHMNSTCVIPVFELLDNVLIPIANFPPNFDEPIGYIEKLVSYEIDGRSLVIDALDRFSGYIDLSPPEVAIKRLFKVRSDLDCLPNITKAQVAKLAELAGQETKAGLTESSLRRARGHVDDLLASKGDIELVVNELLETPAVAQSLDTERQRILSEYKDSLDTHRQEVGSLLERKRKLENDIEALQRQHDAKANQLGDALRNMFERASGDGLKVLSDVALLSPFLGHKSGLPKPKGLPTLKASGIPAREPKTLLGGIVCYSLRHGLSQSILSHAIASSLANGLVGLFGKDAPLFQESIAGTLSGGLTATVSLSSDMFGWGDVLSAPVTTSLADSYAMSLGEFVALAQRSKLPCHISIVGANRIPLETYFPEMTAIAGPCGVGNVITWRNLEGVFTSARVVMPVFFSLVFVRGKSTFQLEAPISSEIVIINCDVSWDKRPVPDLTIKVNNTYVDTASNAWGVSIRASSSAQRGTCEFMQAFAVPKNDADVLASLGYRVGRASIAEMESEAGSMQGDLGKRYLSYLRHESNKLLSQLCESEGSNQ